MPVRISVKPMPEHKLDGAFDAGKASKLPRERVVLGEDGYPVIDEDGREKTVRIRRRPSRQWLTASGHVVHVAATAGSGVPVSADPLRDLQVKERMHAAGAVLWGECPLRSAMALRWVPPAMRKQEPCAPGTYGEKKPCPHVLALRDQRQEAHEKRERLIAERARSAIDRQIDASKEQNAELVKALLSAVENRGKPTRVSDGR